MSSKQILVTGGLGFIGSFIIDELLRKGHNVRAFDNLDPQVHPSEQIPDYANPEVEFIQGDVRDYDALKKALNGIEIVFHKAASVGMAQSQYQIKKYVDVNTGGTANLLDILVNHKNRVEKIIVASSQSSYGEGAYICSKHGFQRPGLRLVEQLERREWEPKCPICGNELSPIPITETAERKSTTIYALTKMDQEEMILNIGSAFKIPSVALRYFNVYGPRQSLSNPYTGVTAIFMSRIKNNHPPIIYEDGRQSRDFISVHDVVRANTLAMETSRANYQTFNVGSGIRTSILEIAETLSRIFRKEDIQPEIVEKFRVGDTRHCFADLSKIRKILGFKPQIGFEHGMAELVEWAQNSVAEDFFEKARAEMESHGLA